MVDGNTVNPSCTTLLVGVSIVFMIRTPAYPHKQAAETATKKKIYGLRISLVLFNLV